MKTVDIIRQSTPEQNGYNDPCAVIKDGITLWQGNISSCPNPFRPSDQLKWPEVYAMIAEGEYRAKCIQHTKFKKCLLVENGGNVPTINPNHKHNEKYYACEIFLHCGYNEGWRGSMGCLTVAPSKYDEFFKNFEVNEDVKILLRKVV